MTRPPRALSARHAPCAARARHAPCAAGAGPQARLLALAAACALALPTLAQATSVQAVYTPLGGSSWQVSLRFSNALADVLAPGLSVYFGATSFTSLRNAVAPAAWDPLLLQPDTSLPAAGVYDVYAVNSANALQPGQTQGGFSLQFDVLGNGTPVALAYEFYKLDSGGNVQLLASGNSSVSVVPEPAAVWLAGLGVVVLLAARRGQQGHEAVNKHGVTA